MSPTHAPSASPTAQPTAAPYGLITFDLTLRDETFDSFDAVKQTKYRDAIAKSLNVDAKFVELKVKASGRTLTIVRQLQTGLTIEVEVKTADQDKHLTVRTIVEASTDYTQTLAAALKEQQIDVDAAALFIAPESITATVTSSTPTANTPANAPGSDDGGSPAGIIAGVLVAVVLVILGLYLRKRKQNKQKTAKIYQASEIEDDMSKTSPSPATAPASDPQEQPRGTLPPASELPVTEMSIQEPIQTLSTTSVDETADGEEKKDEDPEEDLGPSILGPEGTGFDDDEDDDEEDDDSSNSDDDDDEAYADLNILGPPAWIAERWTADESGTSASEAESGREAQ